MSGGFSRLPRDGDGMFDISDALLSHQWLPGTDPSGRASSHPPLPCIKVGVELALASLVGPSQRLGFGDA